MKNKNSYLDIIYFLFHCIFKFSTTYYDFTLLHVFFVLKKKIVKYKFIIFAFISLLFFFIHEEKR